MGSKFSPLDERLRAYPEVMKLANAGVKSPSSIMQTLVQRGIAAPSRETVRRWVLGANSPFSNLNAFVPESSEELSFYIGAWWGDGWGDDNDGGKRMRLKVRSESFAQEFAYAASEILHKTTPYRVWVTRDDDGSLWYNVKVTSKMLYDFVTQDFIKLIKLVRPCPRGFLRGFFTSEGNPSVSVETRRKLRLNIGLTLSNSDLTAIRFSRRLLVDLGYKPGRLRIDRKKGEFTNLSEVKRTQWQLTISRRYDVRRFAEEIGFADDEKQEKLARAIESVRKDGTFGAASAWITEYQKDGRIWKKIVRF